VLDAHVRNAAGQPDLSICVVGLPQSSQHANRLEAPGTRRANPLLGLDELAVRIGCDRGQCNPKPCLSFVAFDRVPQAYQLSSWRRVSQRPQVESSQSSQPFKTDRD
jgi:hypothetical protein